MRPAAIYRAVLVASIDTMASKQDKQAVLEKGNSKALSGQGVLEQQIHQVPSEREVFAGNEDFYKLLEGYTQTPDRNIRGQDSQSAEQIRPIAMLQERFSLFQKILAGSIIAIAAALLFALLTTANGPAANNRVSPAIRQAPAIQPAGDSSSQTSETTGKIETKEQLTQPLSLKVAETFYFQKEYDNAYAAYSQLCQGIPSEGDQELLRDYLRLKMALCRGKAGVVDEAIGSLRTLLKSRSPVVRMLANYHLGMLELRSGQYLKARMRAYQAIALSEAVGPERDLVLTIQRDSYFIAAESITRNILSLCNADKDIPQDLWAYSAEPEVSMGLDEWQLRSVLSRGSEKLTEGVLSPQINRIERPDKLPRWSVICQRAPIDELLARFAADAGVDISWARCASATGEEPIDSIRKRPVSLYLPAVTMQEFVTVAAGHTGLLARTDEKGVVNIFNPAYYASLSEHFSLLIPESISQWQGLLLQFHDDRRIPNAHFALGLLYAQGGQVAEAIAEYKLVANGFSQVPLAPSALLNSSKLKTGLHDYSSAREDLKQLVEQYPDSEFYGQACLELADVTMKAGLWDESARLYRKVFNLGLSLQSQAAAALGAGKCLYGKQDYGEAAPWLSRHIELAPDAGISDTSGAYFLLGKTYFALGKPREAGNAFQNALKGELPKKEYIETVCALVEAMIQQKKFVEALGMLETIRPWQFSQHEYIQILLAKSKVLRLMGLVDRAITTLSFGTENLADRQLRARISFELAECLAADGDLERARNNLTEVLAFVEPGEFAQEVAIRLAEFCFRTGQNGQTILICSQLLDSQPAPQIKQKALNILATAYQQQKSYDKAAAALSANLKENESTNEKKQQQSQPTQSNKQQEVQNAK